MIQELTYVAQGQVLAVDLSGPVAGTWPVSEVRVT